MKLLKTLKDNPEKLQALKDVLSLTDSGDVNIMIESLISDPEKTSKLFLSLSNILNPWVDTGMETEIKNNTVQLSQSVRGFSRTNIFGDVIATGIVSFPRYLVSIEGVDEVSVPAVFSHNDGKQRTKEFLDNKLKELGYVLTYGSE